MIQSGADNTNKEAIMNKDLVEEFQDQEITGMEKVQFFFQQ